MFTDRVSSVDSIYELSTQYITVLSQAKSMEELCDYAQEIVDSFMEIIFVKDNHANSRIPQAIQYVSTHYNEKITLLDVAHELGFCDSYFSRLFKKQVGVSFREYLAQVRVEESKHLLRATDYSLQDIAIAVGFPDQSYFSKVFKRITGITPGQCR